MPRATKRTSRKRGTRGLGASEYAHAAAAGRKLLDLDTVLDNASRASSCSSKFMSYQNAAVDFGNVEAHLRAGVSKATHPQLFARFESARARLVRLDKQIRDCFCKG